MEPFDNRAPARNTVQKRGLPPLTLNASLRWGVVSRLLPETVGDVLEIGCGQGSVTWRIAQRARTMTAIEPDAQSFERAASRLSGCARVMNIADDQLPYDEQFDVVCSFEVLEHIQDDRATLKRWTQRVRKGGQIVISVPAHAQRLGPSDELVGHFRRYDKGDLSAQLKAAGFTDIRETLYGFPVGYVLEAIRNVMARQMLDKGAREREFSDRTASSGRFFQPDGPIVSVAMGMIGSALAGLQRLFPDKGPGLVITARKPE
ncbi:MAG: class I SAM-dependent methyltransferase [Pseudomonadota bacterium]